MAAGGVHVIEVDEGLARELASVAPKSLTTHRARVQFACEQFVETKKRERDDRAPESEPVKN